MRVTHHRSLGRSPRRNPAGLQVEDTVGATIPDPGRGLPSWDEVAHLRCQTVAKVPRPVQRLWAETYIRTLRRVNTKRDEDSFILLYLFPKVCLWKSRGSGKRHHKKRASEIRDRLVAWGEGEYTDLWQEAKRASEASKVGKGRDAQDSEDEKIARATTLAKLGRFSQGNAALTAGGLAEDNDKTWRALEEKHPKAAAAYENIDYGEGPGALKVEPELVLQAIRSFPRGSGAGPSSLRAQFVKDAVEAPDVEGAIAETKDLVNLLLSGEAPTASMPYLAGATLIALNKKDGDVRPIAVGEVWRRLAAKCACAAVKKEAEKILVKDSQVGVAVQGGLEAAVQAVRGYSERNLGRSGKVILKVDLKNAFNSVHRDAMIRETKANLPELLPWVEWCYAGKSNLFMRGKVLKSEEGAQQGDPMGPLLFSLAIAPIVQKMKRETGLDLSLFYLDDGIFAGDKDKVLRAMELFQSECRKIGLEIGDKCEWILLDPCLNGDPKAWGFPEKTTFILDGNFHFLGAPIGDEDYCAKYLSDKVDSLRETFRMLKKMDDKQAAYLLLRYCDSFGKMVFYMRANPGRKTREVLSAFDDMVKDAAEEISQSRMTKHAWTQAKLAIRFGGLGLRSAADHHAAATLASLSAWEDLAKELDPNYRVDEKAWREAAKKFNKTVGREDIGRSGPQGPLSQKLLSSAIEEVYLKKVHKGYKDNPAELARLHTITQPHAASWLTAVPFDGKDLEPAEFEAAVKLWLGLAVYESGQTCRICKKESLDQAGRHALNCPNGGDRTAKHNAVRDELFLACSDAALNPIREEKHTLGTRPGLVPGDVSLPRGVNERRPRSVDVTIVNPMAPSVCKEAAKHPGYAARLGEAEKYCKYAKEMGRNNRTLTAFALESFGGFGAEARGFLRRVAGEAAKRARLDKAGVYRDYAERISIQVVKAAARSVLRRGEITDRGSLPAEVSVTEEEPVEITTPETEEWMAWMAWIEEGEALGEAVRRKRAEDSKAEDSRAAETAPQRCLPPIFYPEGDSTGVTDPAPESPPSSHMAVDEEGDTEEPVPEGLLEEGDVLMQGPSQDSGEEQPGRGRSAERHGSGPATGSQGHLATGSQLGGPSSGQDTDRPREPSFVSPGTTTGRSVSHKTGSTTDSTQKVGKVREDSSPSEQSGLSEEDRVSSRKGDAGRYRKKKKVQSQARRGPQLKCNIGTAEPEPTRAPEAHQKLGFIDTPSATAKKMTVREYLDRKVQSEQADKPPAVEDKGLAPPPTPGLQAPSGSTPPSRVGEETKGAERGVEGSRERPLDVDAPPEAIPLPASEDTPSGRPEEPDSGLPGLRNRPPDTVGAAPAGPRSQPRGSGTAMAKPSEGAPQAVPMTRPGTEGADEGEDTGTSQSGSAGGADEQASGSQDTVELMQALESARVPPLPATRQAQNASQEPLENEVLAGGATSASHTTNTHPGANKTPAMAAGRVDVTGTGGDASDTPQEPRQEQDAEGHEARSPQTCNRKIRGAVSAGTTPTTHSTATHPSANKTPAMAAGRVDVTRTGGDASDTPQKPRRKQCADGHENQTPQACKRKENDTASAGATPTNHTTATPPSANKKPAMAAGGVDVNGTLGPKAPAAAPKSVDILANSGRSNVMITTAIRAEKGRAGLTTTNSCYLQAALNLIAVTDMAQQVVAFQRCDTHEKGELTAAVHRWVTGERSATVLLSVLASISGPFGDGRQCDLGEVLRTVATTVQEENAAHRACNTRQTDRIAGLGHRYTVDVRCGKCQAGHTAHEDLRFPT
ncbi:Retrotransposable element SLACS 132 kDa protein [Diplonema papillatum]|nr:Retrotransposable element SLACS 132 kDa protein [Diplonema papillatum]